MLDALSLPLFVVAAAVAVLGQVMVLRDGLRGRTPAAGTSRSARGREALWIALPALALLLTLLATWRALPGNAANARASTAPVAVLPLSGSDSP